MRYEEPPAISRTDAERALASDDAEVVAGAIISAALTLDDDAWLLGRLPTLAGHESAAVRNAAAHACGHLARLHGLTAERERALRGLVEPLLKDPATRGAAQDALDDLATFAPTFVR